MLSNLCVNYSENQNGKVPHCNTANNKVEKMELSLHANVLCKVQNWCHSSTLTLCSRVNLGSPVWLHSAAVPCSDLKWTVVFFTQRVGLLCGFSNDGSFAFKALILLKRSGLFYVARNGVIRHFSWCSCRDSASLKTAARPMFSLFIFKLYFISSDLLLLCLL